MKRCPYCGKEYPDDAAKCFIDGYPLPEIVQDAFPGMEGVSVPVQTVDPGAVAQDLEIESGHEPAQIYPDYRWSARDGWKCLGMFLFIEFVLAVMDRRLAFFHGLRWS